MPGPSCISNPNPDANANPNPTATSPTGLRNQVQATDCGHSGAQAQRHIPRLRKPQEGQTASQPTWIFSRGEYPLGNGTRLLRQLHLCRWIHDELNGVKPQDLSSRSKALRNFDWISRLHRFVLVLYSGFLARAHIRVPCSHGAARWADIWESARSHKGAESPSKRP